MRRSLVVECAAAALGLVLLLESPAARAGDIPAVPVYQDRLEQFQRERKLASGAAKFSESDREVMRASGEALARRMPEPGLSVGEKAPDFALPISAAH